MKQKGKNKCKSASSANEESIYQLEHSTNETHSDIDEVYVPRATNVCDPEDLEVDESAYITLHQFSLGQPCLSFDFIRDNLGEGRTQYPLTLYMVAGTQSVADTRSIQHNSIHVARVDNITKTRHAMRADRSDGDSDVSGEDSDSDDEEDDMMPHLSTRSFTHDGCVNRIRANTVGGTTYAVAWSELATVSIWNIDGALGELDCVDGGGCACVRNDPVFTYRGHASEGYALDWSGVDPGVLATGDCSRELRVWRPDGSGWTVSQRPLVGHTESIEDIQWSPCEATVLATCSVDKTIRVWDTRCAPERACMLTVDEAHQQDVNVIAWSRSENFLLSGGDDSRLRVWDLRTLQDGRPLADFQHHFAPITSVEWCPSEAAIFASSGTDDQLVQWDLSVESDNVQHDTCHPEDSVAQQVLFIHQGQRDIKELHWHAQIPGCLMSTSSSGFNVFRTISV